jgi:hypothetical protein
MLATTEIDVYGCGTPIRDYFPNHFRNPISIVKDRTEVMPFYHCSLSHFRLTMVDYKERSRSGRETVIALTEGRLPADYDLSQVFYGSYLHRLAKFSFTENGLAVMILEKMMVRAFAHSSTCRVFRLIREFNPQVVFGEKSVGRLESIIERYKISFANPGLFLVEDYLK